MRGVAGFLTLALAASMSAEKVGFEASEGARLALWPSRHGLDLPPKPPAGIRGRVVDAEGEPVSGVSIMVLRSTLTDGRRETLISKMAITNDRGEYRVTQLPPGRYLVKAAGFHDTSMYLGDDPPMPSTHDTFEPTYFPRARSEETAAPIVLEPGAEAHADFSLELKPGRRIRGRITNVIPYHAVAVQLLTGGEDVALNRNSINQENGRFEICDVLDGTYRLRVIQAEADQELVFAEKLIEITGKDLDGVELKLSPGHLVKGTVRLDTTAEKLEDQAGVEISLVPLDGFRFASGSAYDFRSHALSPREFEIRSLIPGRYRVGIAAYGPVYVKSAKAGEADLLATTELVAGTAVAPEIEIVLAADGGTVSGTVTGREVGNLVLLVAESVAHPPLVTQAADEDGTFTFYDVPPGTYRLHVWRESAEVEYAAPRMLRLLAGSGMRLEVKPGDQVTVQVPALPEVPR